MTDPRLSPTTSLSQLTTNLFETARNATSQRASHTVVGGADHHLRQVVITLLADAELTEHESPGEATLLVLGGSVDLRADGHSHTLTAGELIEIPPLRHSLHARENTAVLLTILPREYTQHD